MRGIFMGAGAFGVCLSVGIAVADINQSPPRPAAPGAFTVVCAKLPCRTATRAIQLRRTDGGIVNVSTTMSPFVDENGVVSIYAGEALEISFDRSDLTHPKFVRGLEHVDLQGLKGYQPDAPPPDPSMPALLSLELRQEDGKPNMTLVLRNETGVPLKFDVTMVVPTPDGMKEAHTSTCPLFPGMMGDEAWPHPVVLLLISNFRKAESGQFTCD